MGRWGVGDAITDCCCCCCCWYACCRCVGTREPIGDHQACASGPLRSDGKEKLDAPRESEYHEDRDCEAEECGEEKISSADGGLVVIPGLLCWLMYFCCCRANAFADGEGMEIAGDWLKTFESYCCDISAELPVKWWSAARLLLWLGVLSVVVEARLFSCCIRMSEGGGESGR